MYSSYVMRMIIDLWYFWKFALVHLLLPYLHRMLTSFSLLPYEASLDLLTLNSKLEALHQIINIIINMGAFVYYH